MNIRAFRNINIIMKRRIISLLNKKYSPDDKKNGEPAQCRLSKKIRFLRQISRAVIDLLKINLLCVFSGKRYVQLTLMLPIDKSGGNGSDLS